MKGQDRTMTDSSRKDSLMSRARFADLAETYGADLRRWPEAERAAADRFRHENADAPAILAAADTLDALLDAAPRAVVSACLREQVLAQAEAAQRGRFGRPLFARRPSRMMWTLGAGWAATACAGVIAGMVLTHQITADIQADAVLYQAGLAAVDDTEVLG